MASNEQRGKDALKNLERELNSRDRKEKRGPWGIAALSAVVILGIGSGIYALANHNDADTSTSAEESASTSSSPSPIDAEPLSLTRAKALPETVTCSYPRGDAGQSKDVGTPPTDSVSARGTVTVNLDTSAGPIGMELDRSVSPCTVNSIEYLAKKDYFNDTVCHRLTTSEGLKVLQCGDPTGSGSGGPGFTFANEYPTDEALEKVDTSQIPEGTPADQAEQMKGQLLQSPPPVKYGRGTIAMANAGLGTNGSQFFLNYGDSTLPPMYTYFGKIDDKGLDTLDKIAEKGAEGGKSDGKPAEEVKIEAATVAG
ncbi:peptidylprolyl isomerase [Corynebacterium sp. UBA2622]|uniref:peptidylprolyl isomerase n=1 Tax=Corynebacterium sp. UBA2622 TaxID=1946393 RepID=UPI0025BAFB96|nr:peptidylprolyl isomerase [Corynebacterium sp. UBA2622]